MYPKDIRPLTSLRFAAAMWILLYYFGSHLSVGLRDGSGFVEKGYLGVDLFFVLSGFIMSHVYLPHVEKGEFNYRGSSGTASPGSNPLHLATLGAVIVIWLVALKLVHRSGQRRQLKLDKLMHKQEASALTQT